MRNILVLDYYDACEVIRLLDEIGITGGQHCGCLFSPLNRDTCIRQTKGTVEYEEYKRKFAKGDRDIWYDCPNGTYFEVPDDRSWEARVIRDRVEKKHFVAMLKRQSHKLIEKLDWRTNGNPK